MRKHLQAGAAQPARPSPRDSDELVNTERIRSHRTLDRKRNEPGMSAGDERKRKKEMDKCIATMDKLKAERADQITHCRHVRSTLSKAKDKWLVGVKLCGSKESKLISCLYIVLFFCGFCMFFRCFVVYL